MSVLKNRPLDGSVKIGVRCKAYRHAGPLSPVTQAETDHGRVLSADIEQEEFY
jgi:hypothetical protein